MNRFRLIGITGILLIALSAIVSCEDDAVLEPSDGGDDNGSYGVLYLQPKESDSDVAREHDVETDEANSNDNGQQAVKNPRIF